VVSRLFLWRIPCFLDGLLTIAPLWIDFACTGLDLGLGSEFSKWYLCRRVALEPFFFKNDAERLSINYFL
jgi:hypothetical protein